MERKEAIEVIKKNWPNSSFTMLREALETVIPELKEKESEDERIRKGLLQHLEILRGWSPGDPSPIKRKKYYDVWLSWLEKQGKQEQLYIRFGEIPTDEKSKIYRGGIEVGAENGVSVYPAFKTDEGDIVLGLSLPITKTTLYTQQHLIEYDDRSCYLVKGDYVGKDSDGQPLINNISIIEKIEDYRVKEEKQNKQKPADNVEPKFKIEKDKYYVCIRDLFNQYDDKAFIKDEIYLSTKDGYLIPSNSNAPYQVVCPDTYFKPWTIQDAKDGDVLAAKIDEEPNDFIYIFKEHDQNLGFWSHCYLDAYINKFHEGIYHNNRNVGVPATKEQRDLLFTKMKEAGSEWDAENKELKNIEQNPAAYFYCKYGGTIPKCSGCIRNHLNSKYKTEDIKTWMTPASRGTKRCSDYIPKDSVKWSEDAELTEFESALFSAFSDAWQEYLNGKEVNVEKWAKEHSAELLAVAIERKPTWSEEDERNLLDIKCLIANYRTGNSEHELCSWINKLKDRVQPQPKWSEEDDSMLDNDLWGL